MRGMLVGVTLHPRGRAIVYMGCSLLALLGLHAAFLSLIAGRPILLPLVGSLIFTVAAGGYAWPPIANRTGWLEAARLVGWSHRRARFTFVLINTLTLLLIVEGVIFLATS